MRKTKLFLSIVTILIIVLIFLTSCGSDDSNEQQPDGLSSGMTLKDVVSYINDNKTKVKVEMLPGLTVGYDNNVFYAVGYNFNDNNITSSQWEWLINNHCIAYENGIIYYGNNRACEATIEEWKLCRDNFIWNLIWKNIPNIVEFYTYFDLYSPLVIENNTITNITFEGVEDFHIKFDFDCDFTRDVNAVKNYSSLSFLCKLNANGGKFVMGGNYINYASDVIVYAVENGMNLVVDKDEIPQREGYTFVGWYEDAECTIVFDSSKPITQKTTLYAKWNEV